jgi:hypothetical protein
MLQKVMPCSLIEVHKRFGGTYCLHLQLSKQQREISSKGTGAQTTKDIMVIFAVTAVRKSTPTGLTEILVCHEHY